VASTAEPQVGGASAPASAGEPPSSANAVTRAEPSARAREPALSVQYPGARDVHRWHGGHAHSVEMVTVDPYATVVDYYRRYAAQNPGYKVRETPDALTLDGGAGMGLLTVQRARTEPPDQRLKPGEQTLISSSRP
jgi:hypothetical protein